MWWGSREQWRDSKGQGQGQGSRGGEGPPLQLQGSPCPSVLQVLPPHRCRFCGAGVTVQLEPLFKGPVSGRTSADPDNSAPSRGPHRAPQTPPRTTKGWGQGRVHTRRPGFPGRPSSPLSPGCPCKESKAMVMRPAGQPQAASQAGGERTCTRGHSRPSSCGTPGTDIGGSEHPRGPRSRPYFGLFTKTQLSRNGALRLLRSPEGERCYKMFPEHKVRGEPFTSRPKRGGRGLCICL